jgi:hypothetical protein
LSFKPLRFFIALFVAAFALNWLWEMLQMPAYVDLAGRSWRETVSTCTLASLADAGVTLMVYCLVALFTWRTVWPLTGGWKVYLLAALLGAACAVLIEWVALSKAHWSYTHSMPVLPVLRIGLLPLAQLALLVPAAIRFAAWLDVRVPNREAKPGRG